MDRVADRPNEYPELISAIDWLLLDAQYHWTEILVVGKIIPMFRAIKIFLISLLLDGRQLESLILLPLFFNGSFFSWYVVGVNFVLFEETKILTLLHLHLYLLMLIGLLGIRRLSIALTLVPNCVRRYLLSRTLDPVTRCWNQMMWKLLAEFI